MRGHPALSCWPLSWLHDDMGRHHRRLFACMRTACHMRYTDSTHVLELINGIEKLLSSSKWEHRLGGLMAAKVRVGSACSVCASAVSVYWSGFGWQEGGEGHAGAHHCTASACLPHDWPPLLQELVASRAAGDDFDALAESEALRLLEDKEVRVRLAVGQLLRALAAAQGVEVMERCQRRLLDSINEHFVSAGRGRSLPGRGGGGCVWTCCALQRAP